MTLKVIDDNITKTLEYPELGLRIIFPVEAVIGRDEKERITVTAYGEKKTVYGWICDSDGERTIVESF